jgi:excisionase family DNA binding protein
MSDLDFKDALTRREAAERLGVHISTVDRWIKAGILTRYKIGETRSTRIDPREIPKLLVRQVPGG